MPLYFQGHGLVFQGGLVGFSQDCCCPSAPPALCVAASEWRIVDDSDFVYAQGPVGPYGNVGDPNLPHHLLDFPAPFSPLFYESAGSKTWRLQLLGCNDLDLAEWQTIEEWSGEIIICGTFSERYPSHYTIGPWPPPPDTQCECRNIQNVRLGLEPCDPCPEYVAGTLGSGQGFRDPPPGIGRTFTNAVDGEWTNLLNWQDEYGRSPASALPGEPDDVIVDGDVTSSADVISVDSLTIQAGRSFSVAASAVDLHVYGTVARASVCDGVYGDITVADDAIVYGGGINDGRITTLNRVEFRDGGLNDADGVVNGNGRFLDNSVNEGTVTGDGEFYDSSTNEGTVQGNATFDGAAPLVNPPENRGTVKGNGVFRTRASNIGTVEGNAEFYGTSGNDVPGIVLGSAVFYDNSRNDEGVVQTNATFNGNSINAGPVAGDAEFNNSSVNGASPNYPGSFGRVTGNATFNDTSVNDGGAADTATFNDDSINRGDVTGTATFTGNACNDGGTAGTFVPDPPPSC